MLKNCMMQIPIQIWQDCIIQWLQRSAQVERLGNQDTIALDRRLYSLVMMGQPPQQRLLRMLKCKKIFQDGDGTEAIFKVQEILRGPADVVDAAATSAMGEPEPVRPNPGVAQPFPPIGPNVGSAQKRREQ